MWGLDCTLQNPRIVTQQSCTGLEEGRLLHVALDSRSQANRYQRMPFTSQLVKTHNSILFGNLFLNGRTLRKHEGMMDATFQPVGTSARSRWKTVL